MKKRSKERPRPLPSELFRSVGPVTRQAKNQMLA
jgi:hypothetical protein